MYADGWRGAVARSHRERREAPQTGGHHPVAFSVIDARSSRQCRRRRRVHRRQLSLTDLLDDLADVVDPGQKIVIQPPRGSRPRAGHPAVTRFTGQPFTTNSAQLLPWSGSRPTTDHVPTNWGVWLPASRCLAHTRKSGARGWQVSTEEAPGVDGLLPEQRVGAVMREARESRRISLRTLSKQQLGYQSHTTLSGYERGATMPTDEAVAGYERVLGVEPGFLTAALEAARIERHGDAWAKRRIRVPVEFLPAEESAAADQATIPSSSDEAIPPPRRHRRMWIGSAVVVLVLVTGVIAAVLANQPAAHSAYADGRDPKVTGCASDARTTSNVDVYYPSGHLVGTLELRTSGRCGMSWGRFTPTPALTTSPPVQLEIDAHRPADGTAARFGVTYDGQAAYGNMLESDHECVYATLTLQTQDLGRSPSYQTGCEQ